MQRYMAVGVQLEGIRTDAPKPGRFWLAGGPAVAVLVDDRGCEAERLPGGGIGWVAECWALPDDAGRAEARLQAAGHLAAREHDCGVRLLLARELARREMRHLLGGIVNAPIRGIARVEQRAPTARLVGKPGHIRADGARLVAVELIEVGDGVAPELWLDDWTPARYMALGRIRLVLRSLEARYVVPIRVTGQARELLRAELAEREQVSA